MGTPPTIDTGHPDQSVRLIVCSPNRWEPKIRREHAMVDLARRDGHAVAFIQVAHDVRMLRRPETRRAWLRGWSSSGSVFFDRLVRVRRTSTIVPAHRGGLAANAGHRTAPAVELRRLLIEHGDSVRWHGPVGRKDLSRILDSGRTLIVPHRAQRSAGQDSQKLYEYAARGRPIVSTNWSPRLADLGAPGLAVADDACTFAASVLRLEDDDPHRPAERRQWAEAHRWEHRWDAWSRALFG